MFQQSTMFQDHSCSHCFDFILCQSLIVAFDVQNGLYFASVIIGFCFGAQWPFVLTFKFSWNLRKLSFMTLLKESILSLLNYYSFRLKIIVLKFLHDFKENDLLC